MPISLSERVQRIKPSPTLAVSAKASALKAQGRQVIDLGVGEPDFDTPEHIKQAAIEAIRTGMTKYTPVDGIPALKQAIAHKFRRDNGLEYALEQILVSCGGKQSFYNLAQALLNPGDEVLIPAPYWVSYPDMVLLADATPVFIEAGQEQNFKITPEQLEAAITPKTRLLVLNSPSNPTGKVYSLEELKALAEVLLCHPHVLIATDDMYEHILWQGKFANILNACPELYPRTIVLNGVSKAYAMTGWRIGYAAGPKELIAAMKNIQSQSTSNPASISQAAAVAALEGEQSCIRPMVEAFKQRHDFMVAELNRISGINCLPAEGAFYLFPQVTGWIARLGLKDDLELAEFLLERAEIALVPGSAFGAPGHVRVSIATSLDKLQAAVARLKAL
ncbi:pyridoxal phosphate-dependent aminotransferase [Methylothermus subterraneus]